MIYALILAGGQGTRCKPNTVPKQYQLLGEVSILRQCIDRFLSHPQIDACQVVYREGDEGRAQAACKGLHIGLCVGGKTRQASVLEGLRAIQGATHVLIHDGVRPFVSPALISAVCHGLSQYEAVAPVLPTRETVYFNGQPIPRTQVKFAQTPQGFHYAPLRHIHEMRAQETFTDDISLVMGHMQVGLIPGDSKNIKITDANDLHWARHQVTSASLRVGIGFDTHAFCPGTFVTLCGIQIPHDHGLAGHSDADAGIHAAVDAILGALNQRDIGFHFPSGDPQWKGAPSHIFLEKAQRLLMEKGAILQALDIVIIAQKPILAPHIPSMALYLASILEVCPSRISIKATTTDHLGYVGRREGLAAFAVATISVF